MGSRVLSTRPTVVDSESGADDERLPVGAVPEDVILALESDLCSVVGDAEVFTLTDDAASVHGRSMVAALQGFLLVCRARVHPHVSCSL